MSPKTETPPFNVKVNTDAGDLAPPSMNANKLRRLAEKADGLRDRHPFLVKGRAGEIDVVVQKELKGDEEVLIDLETENSGPGLGFKPVIQLLVDGKVVDLGKELAEADAVFTSQSAVEKFVLPYYSRLSSPSEMVDFAKTIFEDALVVAGHHLPASTYGLDKIVAVKMRPNGKPELIEFAFPKPAP